MALSQEEIDPPQEMLRSELGGLEKRVDSKLVAFEERVDGKFGALEKLHRAELGAMDARLDSKLVEMESHIDAKFDHLETEMAKHQDEVLHHIELFAKGNEKREQEYLMPRGQQSRLEKRVERLEEKAA